MAGLGLPAEGLALVQYETRRDLPCFLERDDAGRHAYGLLDGGVVLQSVDGVFGRNDQEAGLDEGDVAASDDVGEVPEEW